MKILIVDDNMKVREMLSDLLRKNILEIYECGDGAKAVEMYKTVQPDWVLMDLKLETMDGITAIKHIHGEFPDSKIIMVSSFSDERFQQAAKEAGALTYIVKDNLRDVIEFIQDAKN